TSGPRERSWGAAQLALWRPSLRGSLQSVYDWLNGIRCWRKHWGPLRMDDFDDADVDQETKKIAAEHRAIREAMLSLMFTWAGLENTLSIFLGKIIRDPSNALASAIYFTPPNTETRLNIISSVLKMAIGGSPHYEAAIAPAWTRFTKSFGRRKSVRNQVAHGHITTANVSGKNYARLTSPLFDFARIGGPLSQGNLPGLSSNDIRQSAAAIAKLSD